MPWREFPVIPSEVEGTRRKTQSQRPRDSSTKLRSARNDESFVAVRLPDLIIVDGGKGQLSSACRELQRLGLHDLPIIGLAKEHEEIYRPGRALASHFLWIPVRCVCFSGLRRGAIGSLMDIISCCSKNK